MGFPLLKCFPSPISLKDGVVKRVMAAGLCREQVVSYLTMMYK